MFVWCEYNGSTRVLRENRLKKQRAGRTRTVDNDLKKNIRQHQDDFWRYNNALVCPVNVYRVDNL
jgi:hypothetical protein